MKKIILLLFAFVAIFCTAPAQTATTDSFYNESNYPQNLIQLSDEVGNDCGFILVWTEEKEVKIFYVPEDKQIIKKGSRDEKRIVKIILNAYSKNVSKQEFKIKEKVYDKKKLKCLVLEKQT